jgi:tetratricopeptide (TPR) repeat protein
MSTWEEYQGRPEWDREMDTQLVHYWHTKRIYPLSRINGVFQGGDVLFGYYQGGLMCEYIADKFGGVKTLKKMCELYGQDKQTPEVVRTALGITVEQFDEPFRQWLWDTKVKFAKVMPIFDATNVQELLTLADEYELDRKPVPAELAAKIARAYQVSMKLGDAETWAVRATRADPKNALANYVLARLAMSGREPNAARAKSLYAAVMAAGGEDFVMYHHLGAIAREEGDVDKAIEYFETAQAAFPRYASQDSSYYALFQLYLQVGRTDDAWAEVAKVCKIDENLFDPRMQLAERYRKAGNYAEERKMLDEALWVWPYDADLRRFRAQSLVRDKAWNLVVDECVAGLACPEVTLDQEFDLRCTLAETYLNLDEVEDAEDEARAAGRIKPEDPRLAEILARIAARN